MASRVLMGSQTPEELARALEQGMRPTPVGHESQALALDGEDAVTGGDFPLVDEFAVFDNVGATVERAGGADMGRDGEQGRADGELACARGDGDQVFLAMGGERRPRAGRGSRHGCRRAGRRRRPCGRRRGRGGRAGGG